MKVGTDGVLIGAWANCGDTDSHILDIGTGSGLIALMMAQRNPTATITGIELDIDAYNEATHNILNSPWGDRIQIINHDILTFTPKLKYDIIISNPPFFSNSLDCPNTKRNMARHTDTLPLESLISKVNELLSTDGKFSFIYPAEHIDTIKKILRQNEMNLTKLCHVYPTTELQTEKRVLCECMHNSEVSNQLTSETLSIEIVHHVYTPEYIELTKDFYLNM